MEIIAAGDFVMRFRSRDPFGDTSSVGGALVNTFQRLPTEPIGSATVVFTGVVAGSEIRCYTADGVEVSGVESCNANHSLVWPVFSPGAPENDLTIKIVNTAYKIKAFPYTSVVGNQSIPVQMEIDAWYKNPS